MRSRGRRHIHLVTLIDGQFAGNRISNSVAGSRFVAQRPCPADHTKPNGTSTSGSWNSQNS